VTKNITSREVALSNLQENVEFWINTANNALSSIVRPPTEKNNNWYPEMVMAVKLDDEKLRHPISFIKLDIEGYEFRALQGAKKILDGDKPIIVFENSREQAAILCDYIAEDFFRFFINTGYSLYDFWGQPFTLSNWESDDVPWYFIAIHSLDNRTGYLLNIIKQFWGKLDLNIYLDDWNTVVSIISNKRGTY